jgi:NAD(P)H-hydrate epimerase
MRLRALGREEVRSIDARAADELGLPTLALMENAGRGAFEILMRLAGANPGRVGLLCGPGNNGGDAAVVARHLDAEGVPVQVLYLADPARLRGDAAVQHRVLDRAGLAPLVPGEEGLDDLLAGCSWLVDGLLGTGLARPAGGPIGRAIEAINRSGRPVLALDLPSGLDCDTGAPLGPCVRATATATFVSAKKGFAHASAWTGEVFVVPIGVPGKLLEVFRA